VVEFGNRPVILRNPEISHPAAEVFRKLLEPVIHGNEPASAGEFPQPSLESRKGLVRPEDLCALEREAKKGNPVRGRHRTLLLVDPELERRREKPTHAAHDALPGPRLLRQNHEVIGVPGKTQPTAFKLLIEVVE
jgi:hypothetical protein